jgi:hypothetical protein
MQRAGLWYGTFFEGPEGRTVSASVARSGWVVHPQMVSLDYLVPALVKMDKITNFKLNLPLNTATKIPFMYSKKKKIARPQSQFPHSCV